MTVLTFPSNPTNGQRYAAPNGIQYVFDGVKWIVETTSSSSEAVSNSTQDRVAPMFVDGDNTGITFTYNAETNILSAEVTAVNGNQLVNGSKTLTLLPDGALVVPDDTAEIKTLNGGEGNKNIDIYTNNWMGNGVEVFLQHNSGVGIYTDNGTYSWFFDKTGTLTLPAGGDIKDSTGSSVLTMGFLLRILAKDLV